MINVFTVDYFLLQVVTFTTFSVLKESFFFFFIRATQWIRLFCLVICVRTDVQWLVKFFQLIFFVAFLCLSFCLFVNAKLAF